MELKIGDRVKLNADDNPGIGAIGTIIRKDGASCGVEFDNNFGGHSLSGLGKDGHCWNVSESHLDKFKELEFKVGDKFLPKEEFERECVTLNGYRYDYIEIDSIDSDGINISAYSAYKNGSCVGSCSYCFKLNEIEHYKEPEIAVDYALPSDLTATAMCGGTIASAPATTAVRMGWMDEPIFIPNEPKGQKDYTETVPIYKTNAKYKPKADNIRKLMGLRNHKSRVAA